MLDVEIKASHASRRSSREVESMTKEEKRFLALLNPLCAWELGNLLSRAVCDETIFLIKPFVIAVSGWGRQAEYTNPGATERRVCRWILRPLERFGFSSEKTRLGSAEVWRIWQDFVIPTRLHPVTGEKWHSAERWNGNCWTFFMLTSCRRSEGWREMKGCSRCLRLTHGPGRVGDEKFQRSTCSRGDNFDFRRLHFSWKSNSRRRELACLFVW